MVVETVIGKVAELTTGWRQNTVARASNKPDVKDIKSNIKKKFHFLPICSRMTENYTF